MTAATADLPRVAYLIGEVAAMTGKKPRALRNLVAAGKIPGTRVGREILVPATWVESVTAWPEPTGVA